MMNQEEIKAMVHSHVSLLSGASEPIAWAACLVGIFNICNKKLLLNCKASLLITSDGEAIRSRLDILVSDTLRLPTGERDMAQTIRVAIRGAHSPTLLSRLIGRGAPPEISSETKRCLEEYQTALGFLESAFLETIQSAALMPQKKVELLMAVAKVFGPLSYEILRVTLVHLSDEDPTVLTPFKSKLLWELATAGNNHFAMKMLIDDSVPDASAHVTVEAIRWAVIGHKKDDIGGRDRTATLEDLVYFWFAQGHPPYVDQMRVRALVRDKPELERALAAGIARWSSVAAHEDSLPHVNVTWASAASAAAASASSAHEPGGGGGGEAAVSGSTEAATLQLSPYNPEALHSQTIETDLSIDFSKLSSLAHATQSAHNLETVFDERVDFQIELLRELAASAASKEEKEIIERLIADLLEKKEKLSSNDASDKASIHLENDLLPLPPKENTPPPELLVENKYIQAANRQGEEIYYNDNTSIHIAMITRI